MLFSIHSLFGSTVHSGPGYSHCFIVEDLYRIFAAFYSIIIIQYLLSPTLMIIFGLLTTVNARRTRRHIRPRGCGGYAQQKDRHLLRMLLIQMLINVFFTISAQVHQI